MIEASSVYTLRIEGEERSLPCEREKTILRALIDGGIFLEANCGGRGTCGKCKIQVLEGPVIGKDGIEIQPDKDNMYQACQVYPQGDITIVLKRVEVSQKGQAFEIVIDDDMPLLQKVVLAPAYPTVDNHYSLQEMIRQALDKSKPTGSVFDNTERIASVAILRQLSEVVETTPKVITVTMLDSKVIAVEAGDTSSMLYGVAFDIGTTTVVGMLVDINAKKIVAVSSKNNPQAAMGADVISRIQATHELEGGLERLSGLIRHCLNQIIAELCSSVGVTQNHIYAGTIAGNATMAHLVLEISPSTLVRKPYAALFNYISPLSPKALELDINPQGKIIMLPNIASFVGSDTTAAILAVDQDIAVDPILMVDLGTNGEMAIGDGKKLYVCSTAAGPAFEGAHIRDGMRAADGAISDVTITEQAVSVQVIGNVTPVGICGSGIVKAIAELVKNGILHASGRFNKPEQANLPDQLRQRLKKKDGQWEFVLYEGENSDNGADISITQEDVRQLQLVKSSICTGIQFLIDRMPAETQYNEVCLAGAFGNYIDIDSALTIGLLPGFKREAIRSVGNAAGTGAVQALLSAGKMQRCITIANKVSYIELAAQPEFQNRFLKNLSFTQS